MGDIYDMEGEAYWKARCEELEEELQNLKNYKEQTMGEAARHKQFMQQHVIQPGETLQIKVDLSKSPPRACACGCMYFTQAVTVHVISALISPTGQELTAQVPVLICLECKAVLTLGKREG